MSATLPNLFLAVWKRSWFILMSHRRKSPIKSEKFEPERCTVDLRLQILGQLSFFETLSPENINDINKLFRESGYLAGESIYFAGDETTHLYVVASGKIKLLRHTLSGQDVLLDILTPGEFFGTLSSLGDGQYPDTAVAQTAACVLSISAEDFQTILGTYPGVALKVLAIVSKRLQAAHERIRQLSAHSVEQRIAHILLKLAEKLGEPSEMGLLIQLPLSREDLASMAGTTTETASRIMSRFQKEGLIRSGRQWVAVQKELQQIGK